MSAVNNLVGSLTKLIPTTAKSQATVAGVAGASALAVDSFTAKAGPSVRLGKMLRLPLYGSMVDFEKALFSDLDNLRFVKVVLASDKLIPFDTWLFQLGAFGDLINDINQTADFGRYIGNFGDLIKSLMGTLTNSQDADMPTIGLTLLFVPDDVLLPSSVWAHSSMSIISQMTYHVSLERINKYSYMADISSDGRYLEIAY